MPIEYGPRTTANYFKRQYEQLCGAEGEPIVILDCYDDSDTVVVTGTYRGNANERLVIESATGTSEQLTDTGSELLVGFDAIDQYVESAITHYEDDDDVMAGLVAVSLIDRFSDHFPSLPREIVETIAHDVCNDSEYLKYLVARDASNDMRALVDTIMLQYIRQFRSPQEAINAHDAMAYIAACTDPDDNDAQLRYLLDCRRA